MTTEHTECRTARNSERGAIEIATMSVEAVNVESESKPDDLAIFRRQDAAIAEMSREFMSLTINGVNDRAGFNAVHEARMSVRNCRTTIEKTRVQLKAEALEWGRRVDAEAKRLTALVAPVEQYLTSQENAVIAERDRIKREAEEAAKAALQKRLDSLKALGAMHNPLEVQAWSDEQFDDALGDAQVEAEKRAAIEAEAAAFRKQQEEARIAEQMRIDELRRQEQAAFEVEKRKLEEARREQAAAAQAERDRLAAIQREQEAKEAALAAERRRLDDEAASRRRESELEQARKDAAERARVETERRISEQAAREKADKEATEAARLKAESERPYREKLIAYAARVWNISIDAPDGPHRPIIIQAVAEASATIREIAEGPLE